MNVAEWEARAAAARERMAASGTRVCVCSGASCMVSGGDAVLEATEKAVKSAGLEGSARVVKVGCMGTCSQGPLVRLDPDGVVYQKMDASKAGRVIDKHLKNKALLRESLLFAGPAEPGVERPSEHPFYARQLQVVLEHCGRINPEDIDEYLAVGGYRALYKALSSMSPEEVIGEVKMSGLRGRGGAGFPTGLKWETAYRHVADHKYVVCNGDEGDPGAFMDRAVMEGDPQRILEGMAIAAYAVGADRGFIYVRGEFPPLAIRRLGIAIEQARAAGLLGRNILETGFNFDIEIRIGAGAYVCGEETALLISIEGRRGVPRPRPPFPAESGLWGKPTLLNNVETYAGVAPIIERGGEWYSTIGTAKSMGTKVFALAGAINRTGLIEVPMGITLREIIYDIGGGIPGGRRFKAAQTGGPVGGCIPEQYLDVRVDYESLVGLGSMMGSGGLIVMDDTTCMVNLARYFMEFCMDESCGKCVPCRVGTRQMHLLLSRICGGEGTERDLALLEELAPYCREASLCGLGQGAPNTLMSTLRHFRDEYLVHIREKRCPAGECAMAGAPAGVR